jgi:hypothetical protein
MHGVKEQVDSEMRELKYPVSVDPRVIPTTEKPKEAEGYTAQPATTDAPSSGAAETAPQQTAHDEQTPAKNGGGSSEGGKGSGDGR